MAASIQRHDLLRRRLERFTRLLPGVERGDVTALHRTRVASRRLRELLPVLRLDHDTTDKLGRRLRRVTARLGTVRELDVLLILVGSLHESRRQERAALARVAEGLGRERAAALDRMLGKQLPVRDLKQIARKLSRVVDALGELDADTPDDPVSERGWRWALDARVAWRAALLRDAVHEAGAVYLPERLHVVRIAVKKLRYSLELSAEVAGVRSTPELHALKRAQGLLGRLHDLHVLLDRVRDLQVSLTPPNVAVWPELDRVIAAVENSCRRRHARYMRERGALETISEQLAARPPRAGARTLVSPGRGDIRRAAV
jgi:CHAD domain-containing protein